jgi:hypothetical protein
VSVRHLAWEGCWNARDLGGLPTADGRRTRWGRVVRSDALDALTVRGWAAVVAHGVRTVIDLRDEDEAAPDASPRPASLHTVRLPHDASEDREFWDVWRAGPQFATPLYYAPHLERFPRRSTRVLQAVARARPGGVVIHCAAGRDRTGLVCMLLLWLVGVDAGVIAADYDESARRLSVGHAARAQEDEAPLIQAFLAEQGTTAADVIRATLGAERLRARLGDGGLTAEDVAALRRRLLDA